MARSSAVQVSGSLTDTAGIQLHARGFHDKRREYFFRRQNMTKAFYPGSFDPMTNGHLDVLLQALNIAAKVVVGIGIHPGKTPLFSFDERAELIRKSLSEVLPGRSADVDVVSFDNLVVHAARAHGTKVLIRGLRDGTDLDYEMQMAGMNRQMAPDVQTLFLPAGTASRPITATLVRQIAAMGGDVSAFVPKPVLEALQTKRKR
ncbi:MAG: pantetheine-phosphate adenylyltransferase [Rhizobium sp.]|nr:pantetheine-phosphate adenylyltransferase [Rhizobium sp.]